MRSVFRISPDWVTTAQLKLEASVFDIRAISRDSFLVQGLFRTPDRIGKPVHLASFSDGLLQGFAEDDSPSMPGHPERNRRALGYADSGRVWVARHNAYEAWRYTYAGVPEVHFRRDVEWFPTWAGYVEGEGDRVPPRPFLLGVHELHRDVVITAILVAEAEWRPNPRALPRNLSDIYDTVLEALRVSDGSVLASTRIDDAVAGFVGPQSIYFVRADRSSRHVFVRVSRVQLFGKPAP
jgi:hypothetical protein